MTTQLPPMFSIGPADGQHNCTFYVIGVQHAETDGPYGPVTHALIRCSGCGHVYTQPLSGTWTLAQARGEDPQSSTPTGGTK